MRDELEVTTTAAESREQAKGQTDATAPFLFVALHCEAPRLGGARYRLADLHEVVFGRGPTREATREETSDGRVLTVRFPGTYVSKVHARLLRVATSWVLVDNDSRNGTFLNGKRITRAPLSDGDIFECGRTLFVFRAARSSPSEAQQDRNDCATGPLATLLPELEASHARLGALARSSLPIVLLGESGAGKELVASTIHEISKRSGAFVAMNCAAIPGGLLESHLFGHVKGAFSGAVRDELGHFRAADQGTLFLDELGDLPLTSQAAFLRALEEGAVVPVGTTRPLSVDVRIVAATNRPLHDLVAKGAFREDLLARLSGFTHRLLPLRERIEDLGSLIAALLPKLSADKPVVFTPEAARKLLAHDWPLNIRELRHALASAIVIAAGSPIDVEHVTPSLANAIALRSETAMAMATATSDDLEQQLKASLFEHQGNVAAVARSFGKAPIQIYRWLKQFGLDADAYRRR
jgi:DNA-binding NtrC family response regulator